MLSWQPNFVFLYRLSSWRIPRHAIMKLLSFVCLALAGSRVVCASPVAHLAPAAVSTNVELNNVSINEAELALATLERRLSCRLLRHTLRSIGTSKVTYVRPIIPYYLPLSYLPVF